METLDLVKILAGCPKGTPLYSTIHGDVKFESIDEGEIHPIRVSHIDDNELEGNASFTSDGRYFGMYSNAECVLFPSKDCRDWSQFKPRQKFQKGDHIVWNSEKGELLTTYSGEKCNDYFVLNDLRHNGMTWHAQKNDVTKIDKFDPKLFETGDAVLVRDLKDEEWEYAIFSHITTMACDRYFVVSCTLKNKCIPYNVETKHLVGTTDDAPEFYNFK